MATAASAKLKPQYVQRADWNATSMALVLAGLDFCSTSFAVFMGFRLWSFVNPRIPPLHPAMFVMPILSVASLLFFGLYPGIGLNAVTQMRRATHAQTLVFLLFTAAMFMAKDRWADSRGGFFLAWLFSLITMPILRLVMGEVPDLKIELGHSGCDYRFRKCRSVGDHQPSGEQDPRIPPVGLRV
jgi:hypothetical protein